MHSINTYHIFFVDDSPHIALHEAYAYLTLSSASIKHIKRQHITMMEIHWISHHYMIKFYIITFGKPKVSNKDKTTPFVQPNPTCA